MTLCSQEVAAEKREKAKGEKVEVRKKRPKKKSEGKWSERETEACGGLWAGVAAASAQSAGQSSPR